MASENNRWIGEGCLGKDPQYRTGQNKRLSVVAVKAGELVKYDPFDEEIIVHAIEDPDEREQAEKLDPETGEVIEPTTEPVLMA